ncbi:hypothetical protein DGG96_13405 [Legionella qingyii]|uniref:Uncharacterized protein n=1 Tax=Legionella qingyii TaxID=2184757 RepID=A0A317U3R1_9GAMM|nr:hypothetical protein [Legionella qingyii]PWY55172.1 hypothetical protein DGG96_13405 [Legionella qingyii]RUR25406.1 hypothetical protein ELY20_02825 [Legionella qingyii]RUR28483.1 hypothetical protein ELY16_03185 [Legionella qingyii]
MPIHFFSEEEQAPILHHYNETQTKKNKIPHLLRNYNSGWPLLQVSLFSLNDTVDPIKYEHVLGGGTCHFFYIGAFNFASLLTKIPGNMEIIIPHPIPPQREQIKADNVLLFLKAFSIHHKKLGIKIISTSGGYGKNLTIELPVGNAEQLRNALSASFSFALKEHASIKAIGLWEDSDYTQKQIEDAINPEVAVFINGQIFIDLGMLLKQTVKDKEINLLFKYLFKVNAFLELTKNFSDFKPNSTTISGISPETPAKPLESNLKKTISFFQEEKKDTTPLHDMADYSKAPATNQRSEFS